MHVQNDSARVSDAGAGFLAQLLLVQEMLLHTRDLLVLRLHRHVAVLQVLHLLEGGLLGLALLEALRDQRADDLLAPPQLRRRLAVRPRRQLISRAFLPNVLHFHSFA